MRRRNCRRTMMMLTVLVMSAIFFLFFGNGAASDPSLYYWIGTACGGLSWEVLLALSGLALYFIANKRFRHEIVAGEVSPRLGMTMIAAPIGVAVWAFLGGYPVFSLVALIALVFAVIFAFHGRGADIYLMILVLCFFALPVSPLEPLGPFFQFVTSRMVQAGLSALDIGFTGHASKIFLNGFWLQIAEVCSGMRSIELSLKFSIFICIIYPMRWAGRLLFIGLSVLVGAVSNLIRLAVVFWFALWKGQDFALTMGHEVVGPIIGMGIILSYFFLTSFLLAKLFHKKKRACCERRMDRKAPGLFAFTAACLCFGTVICLLAGAPGAPPDGYAFKWISEIESAGSWRRADGLYCESPGCLISFPAGKLGKVFYIKKCPACGAVIREAARSVSRTNEEERLEVFRTRYRNAESSSEAALAIVRGGRPGLSICNPVWYLRSIGATVDRGSRETLDVADFHVKVHHITFEGGSGNGQTGAFSGIYWYVSDDKISSRRFHLKSAFQRFSKDEWVCLVYCKQHEGSDAELVEFARALINKGFASDL